VSKDFGVGIIIFISVLDMGTVDKMIIEPSSESYRNTTLKKQEFLDAYLKEDSIIRFLKSDTSKFRILPLGTLEGENRWSAFQLESVGGYHPAKMENYNKLMSETGWNYPGILQMLNVKYLISLEPFEHPLFSFVHEGSLYVPDQYKKAYVYQFNAFENRLFFSQKISKLTTDSIMTKMKAIEFVPQKVSYVTVKIPAYNFDESSIVELITWSPNRIKIKTVAPSPQFLVISEIFYPEGWSIEAHPELTIIEVNNSLRGVMVPAGELEFDMIFDPKDIKYGTMITLLSFTCIMGLIIFPWIKKK